MQSRARRIRQLLAHCTIPRSSSAVLGAHSGTAPPALLCHPTPCLLNREYLQRLYQQSSWISKQQSPPDCLSAQSCPTPTHPHYHQPYTTSSTCHKPPPPQKKQHFSTKAAPGRTPHSTHLSQKPTAHCPALPPTTSTDAQRAAPGQGWPTPAPITQLANAGPGTAPSGQLGPDCSVLLTSWP